MIKRRKYYGGFTRPPTDSSDGNDSTASQRAPRRLASVYDAVAGKVTQRGLVDKAPSVKDAKQPLRPDEVLFKQSNAPIRYEETDYYYAHTRLPPDQKLPSGDLLSALHAHVSKLYASTEEPGSKKAWKCMDETALIALGILVEETAREVLGETGDLAFLEGADEEEVEALAARGEMEGVEEKEMERPVSRGGGTEEESDSSAWSSSDDSTEESD
ncbi:hypothetical protein P153DRAFT_280419 [Dothidotthia symphoricarpi CBS 119687]|uniref:Uncharacterized protein n=1 Tax=Dothidotthia symphoricarpi CBS 119687 TaxID=1392245 RepID=A0A6A6AU20_9PLEO|nr:uncharacterized protein P153DRAFT_280419 [Dothidotthia symphoricarpi CBS 119687]KAF2134337.1 hypothetical protein P153DRAFT_280419 [Dothidotthia symphoricarpi CBS 119687]